MKIEITIEKDGKEDKKEGMDEPMHGDLTPEQIAEMVAKLKNKAALKRSDRLMLANYLMQDKED